MGVTLQNTAHSVNIKERLDFSCALFDRRGELVANAQHIPVHLGSMDRSVQAVLRRAGMSAGRDVVETEHGRVGQLRLPFGVVDGVADQPQVTHSVEASTQFVER